MTLAEGFARQLSRPHGAIGAVLGSAMDLANRAPTRIALDLLDPQAGERVLDAGCGTGAALAALLRRAPCKAMGIDPSPVMISAARRKLGMHVQLVQGTVETGSLPRATIDAVMALNVLYFCGEDAAMTTVLHDSLRPGGRLVAYVTHRETMEGWSFARQGFHRLFDVDELVALLIQAGFARDAIEVQTANVTRTVKGIWARATRQAD